MQRNRRNKGVITFVFDDGYQHIFDEVVPLLDRYQLPGVFAIPLNTPNWQQWLALSARGHEIAAHSVTHENLTQLSDQQLADELNQPAQALGATTLVYPGGAYDDRVMKVAAKYYTAARTVQRGFETVPPRERYQLKTFNWTRRNFSLWKANALAMWASLTNTWLIETYHIVSDQPTDETHAVSQAAFARHLAFVSHLPLAVRTIRESISV